MVRSSPKIKREDDSPSEPNIRICQIVLIQDIIPLYYNEEHPVKDVELVFLEEIGNGIVAKKDLYKELSKIFNATLLILNCQL